MPKLFFLFGFSFTMTAFCFICIIRINLALFRINLENNFRVNTFLYTMNYLALGCEIEYQRAAKRLEELVYAQPGTLEAQERKELLSLFVQHIKNVNQNHSISFETWIQQPFLRLLSYPL